MSVGMSADGNATVTKKPSWETSARIGLRELRSGLGGFRIFVACLALGVMVIAAVGALSDALRHGMAEQGRTILGGDITASRMHARLTADERATFEKLGRVSETAMLRTMARTLDSNEQALIELKAVDSVYPLTGDVTLKSGDSFQDVMAAGAVVADGMLLQRLGVEKGDDIRIGAAQLKVGGVLESEPDGVTSRLTYGPRVFVSMQALDKTELVQPGSLVRWRYAILRPEGAPIDKTSLKAQREELAKALPDAGLTFTDRHDPNPRITRMLDRLRQFLILIGLASLLVGGVGIANAVSTFVDKRVKVIATLKSLGASGRQVMQIFLTQIIAMSLIGIVIGLALGCLVPFVVNWLYGDAIPVRMSFALSTTSLSLAALYGVVVALLFALWPLGRVENVKASVLFRDSASRAGGWPSLRIIFVTALLLAVLVAIALLTSDPMEIAFYVLAGLIAMLVVFAAMGHVVMWAANRFPLFGSPELRLAIRNIGAPDGLTRSVVLSLGTGLSLLVAVALCNASLVSELRERLPENSPDYFLLDVPHDGYDALAASVKKQVAGVAMANAAMLRGRIVRLNDVPAEDVKADAEAQWVLNGDRGLSYSATVPEGSSVVAGEWWPKDYAGPPLVSFEGDLARGLGLKLGDTVTVNVLGRNIEAKISNLREVQWESLAINFVMVFTPNTLEAAPHNLLATIKLPEGTPSEKEATLFRSLGKEFPAVSAIRVRDALDQFNDVFSKIMTAVQAAGGITLLAGALVLAGALATAQRRRILEAVILKTLGARRRQVMAVHSIEYGILVLVAAVVAIVLGSVIAWVAVTQVMDLSFVFSGWAVVQTLLAAGILIAVFGSVGTWSVLKAPAVPYLRSE